MELPILIKIGVSQTTLINLKCKCSRDSSVGRAGD